MLVFEALTDSLKAGRDVVLVTVVRAQGSTPQKAGRHMLVFRDGSIVGTIGGGTIEHRVIAEALSALEAGQPRVYSAHLTRDLAMCCGGTMEVFLEPITSAPDLVIFGGGHVAEALCPTATSAGFKVTIVDEREEFTTKARFPTAHALVCADPVDALRELPAGDQCYMLIVTHSHRVDEELLRALAHRPLAYLGMIGSRAKVSRFATRLVARGVPAESLERVHMPVGLDIGAVTPSEIAISIAAQLVQIRRKGASAAAHPMTLRVDQTRSEVGT